MGARSRCRCAGKRDERILECLDVPNAALAERGSARIGAPTTATGSSDPSELSRGAFRQAMVAYAAGDYRAVIRATNMGKDYTLTENYTARSFAGCRGALTKCGQ